ncbi:hypothetical protein DSO57_1022799 [Entomophthora muscae]|uniref:Uncharacterized protein n=1 Tax=Entomophthora muscae TaxID=34485 RepID=A0ACC2TE36_9FUNG|nr:hypothetical protein DSO57_1022799 [Entomophthora muscae]
MHLILSIPFSQAKISGHYIEGEAIPDTPVPFISSPVPQEPLDQPDIKQLPTFTHHQWCMNHGVATEFPESPANVSYNTQGALDELPLDISNVMD